MSTPGYREDYISQIPALQASMDDPLTFLLNICTVYLYMLCKKEAHHDH